MYGACPAKAAESTFVLRNRAGTSSISPHGTVLGSVSQSDSSRAFIWSYPQGTRMMYDSVLRGYCYGESSDVTLLSCKGKRESWQDSVHSECFFAMASTVQGVLERMTLENII